MGSSMSIVVEGLYKSYGTGDAAERVLDDVDLEIETGEFVAIVGTSGSGKTTLLNVLGGLDCDYRGSVHVDGHELSELPDRDIARLRNRTFGFVFQQFNLVDHMTVRENVDLPGYFERAENPGGESSQTDPLELLERVGLGAKRDAHPNLLSGGEQQRVAIARALYGTPKHILCDEPTGNLDRRTGLQIMKAFQRLNREDEMTLVVVTHEDHIARMARRIVRLEDGRIVSDEPNDPVQPAETSIVQTDGAAPRTT